MWAGLNFTGNAALQDECREFVPSKNLDFFILDLAIFGAIWKFDD
jgi:hypothetical protein